MSDPYAALREAVDFLDDEHAPPLWSKVYITVEDAIQLRALLAERDALAGQTVTRFEVIDHRTGDTERGRIFVALDCRIEPSVQDDGRTIKVFVGDMP